MKLHHTVAMSLLILSSLACAGLEDFAPPPMDDGTAPEVAEEPDANDPMAMVPSQELTEPWTGMDLPIGDGKVLRSVPENLAVTYSGNKVKELGPKYRDALEAAGWEQAAEVVNDTSHVLNYKKDGKTMGMAVSFANDMTTVGASIR